MTVKQVPTPTGFKLNGEPWAVEVIQGADPTKDTIGRCFYMMQRVQLYTHHGDGRRIAPAKRNEVLWHEITHAVLDTMEHPLAPRANTEAFVTEFARLLSEAIDTARFDR